MHTYTPVRAYVHTRAQTHARIYSREHVSAHNTRAHLHAHTCTHNTHAHQPPTSWGVTGTHPCVAHTRGTVHTGACAPRVHTACIRHADMRYTCSCMACVPAACCLLCTCAGAAGGRGGLCSLRGVCAPVCSCTRVCSAAGKPRVKLQHLALQRGLLAIPKGLCSVWGQILSWCCGVCTALEPRL